MYVEFKKGEKYPQKNADESESHEHFTDSGWVLTENDIVIDLDNFPREFIEKLITNFNIKTQIVWTDRGCHFYFKKPDNFKNGANAISPIGIKYEIKHKGNTKAVTIKRNGVLRDIENEGMREDLHFLFTKNKRYEELYGMSEGDGRNNALFKLKTQIGTNKDWRKIIYFINENVFADPLNDKELELIVRDYRVDATKGNEYDMATWLLKEFDVLKYGERYYFKHEGKYEFKEDLLNRKIFQVCQGQSTRYVNEVLCQMRMRCPIIDLDHEPVFHIDLQNGYLKDGKFYDLKLDSFTPYSMDLPYNKEASPVKIVDDYINHLTDGDSNYRKLLFEILGHTFIVNPEIKRAFAKFFIFVGGGGNGKGTLLQIIKRILGAKNVTALSIKDLSKESYLSSFKGKLANLGDDIQNQPMDDDDMKMLKNLSSADSVSTRELYSQSETVQFTGTLIFTSNHVIKSWEKGDSVKRRIVWLPMFTKVGKMDNQFITKITTKEALEYWMKLIVEGYLRLHEQGNFTESNPVTEFNEEWWKVNDPSLEYLTNKSKEDFEDVPVKEIYENYEDWCNDNEVSYSKNMISNTIEKEFDLVRDYKWINGSTVRAFVSRK
mgnify:FL=1